MTKYLLPFLCVFLCSCASLLEQTLKKPEVELESVTVKDANFKGATLMFNVAVKNPNSSEIKVDQVSYKVYLNDKEVSEANTDKPVSIPGKSTGIVTLPLPLEYRKIFSDVGSLLLAESASYKIEGKAKLKLFSIPFSKEGRIQLR